MKYQLITGRNVSDQDIFDAVKLDELVYPEQYRGKLPVCLNWHHKNPDIYTILKDEEGRVIAYVNVLPVTNECYMDLYVGRIHDVDITEDMILTYEPGTFCNIYLSSIVIHPAHCSIHALRMLILAVLKQLQLVQVNRVFIQRILADAVSPSGIKLCRMLKMRQIGQTQYKSVLFDTTFHMLVAAGSAIFT